MSRAQRRHVGRIAAAAIALLLVACAGEIPLDEGMDRSEIENRAEWLNVAGMNRDQIIARIGEPWISDPGGGVDVFRVSQKQHNVLLVFAPYPVPLPYFSRRYSGYSLVSYAPDGSVAGADWAFAVSEASKEMKQIALAGDYSFVATGWDDPNHSTLSVMHDRWLASRATDLQAPQGCTLLPVCAPPGFGPDAGQNQAVCWNKLAVDGKNRGFILVNGNWMMLENPGTEAQIAASQRLPGVSTHCMGEGNARLCGFVQILSVPLQLEPGTHRLEFTAHATRGSATATLDCKAGDLWYATFPEGKARVYSLGEQITHGLDVGEAEGTVELSREVPAGHPKPAVLLYYGGHSVGGEALDPRK